MQEQCECASVEPEFAILPPENPRASPKKQDPIRRDTPHMSRNSPCSCGSGLKFKKCCLLVKREVESQIREQIREAEARESTPKYLSQVA